MLCLLLWGLYFGKIGDVALNVDISGLYHSRMFGFTYHCWIGLEHELTTALVFDMLPHFSTFEGGMFLLTEGIHGGGRKLSFAFGAFPVDNVEFSRHLNQYLTDCNKEEVDREGRD